MNRDRDRAIHGWRIVGYAACMLFTLTAAAGLARAEVFYDVTVGLNVGDDARIFLNVTNDHFAPPEREATVIVRRCRHPEDDYPVVLFLSHASGVPAGKVLDLRLRGLSWGDVMFRLKIGPSVLFARFDRDPGPPYGKAWGHYKKHKKGGRIALSDGDIVGLAKLQIAARHYGVNPHTIVSERGKGVSIEKFTAAKHRARHGKAKSPQAKPAKNSGKGSGKSKKH